MSGLLAFRNRPSGVAEGGGVKMKDFSALATNWALVPANDNVPPEDGFGNEREVQYEPSIQLIMESEMARAVASGSAAVWIRPLCRSVRVTGPVNTPPSNPDG